MFKDIAFEYYESDLFVIPLRGKIPLVKNWSMFSNQKPSELLIESWCSKYPKANVGLLTGKLSGIIAVDIDKESAMTLVPLSPVAKKGKKGETRFFRYNGETNCKRHDLGIELLSTGNQTVLPPSIHPETGVAYYWTTSDDLLSFDIEDLPVLPPEFFELMGQVSTIKGDTLGRHNSLIEICGAMVGRGEDATFVIKELQKFDVDNHKIPYFTDKSEPHKGAGYQAALSMYMSVVKTATQKGEFEEPKEIELVFSEAEIQKKIDEATNIIDVKFPEPKGYVKILMDEILARSHKPRPKLALMSALATVGCLASNKYAFGDTSPNMYCLFIAESGQGKDVPLKAAKEFFIEAGLLHLVGLEQYRGDKSIVKKFEDQRERVDTIDEVSKFLKTAKSSNIFSNSMTEILTELWNSGTKLFMGFTNSEDTTGMTFNPCLTLVGATTPNSFSETFSSDMMMQGFGGRLMFAFDTVRVRLQEPKSTEMSDDLDMFFQHYGNLEIITETVDITRTGTVKFDLTQSKPQATQVTSLEKPLPRQMKVTQDAKEKLKELMYYYDELAHASNASIKPIVHRAYQQIKKISTNYAIGLVDVYKREEPVVNLDCVMFAHEFVEASIKQTDLFFKDYLIKSAFHKQSTRVIEVLKGAKNGLTQKELTRKLVSQFKSSDLYDKRSGIVTNLVEAGRIIVFKEPLKEGQKRATTRFILDNAID